MKDRGFSLLELIVVLVLIGLATSLVVPSLSRVSKTIELQAAAKKVSGILRYYRSEAVNKGLVYQVLFDSESREVKVQSIDVSGEKEEDEKKEGTSPKKMYVLPSGIQMKEIDFPSPGYPSDLPAIEFYPNGTSSGGTILLDSQSHKGYRIQINLFTGGVKVEKV
jgi:general secretion pathway protein H